MDELTELDGQCSICREQGKPTYHMEASCQNCGRKVAALLTRGHEAHHLTTECPSCGNRHWTIGKLIDSNTATVSYQTTAGSPNRLPDSFKAG